MANLAQKYRPKNFNDVVEQDVVVDMLRKFCEDPNMDVRNFLLIGPAGCGKSSLSFIIANTLNDHNGGYIFMDAASHGSAEDVRKLVEQAYTYPIGTNYKVMILDECHVLSFAAWSSLLTTLESNPAKTIFILCTTNPEKIPSTILSRVQTFQLSKISLSGIISRLEHIISCENTEGRHITYTPEAIGLIAKLAYGGLRDACTLLDKALAYSENLTSESVSIALNLPSYDDYFLLLNSYAKQDIESISRLIDRVYNSGVNFVKWFEEFHSFVINIIKFIFMQDINATIIPAHYLDKLSNYGSKHAGVCLKLANRLLKMLGELKRTSYLQEIALTYLCTHN